MIACWRLRRGRVDRAGDAVEGLVQLVAEQRGAGDDGDTDEGGDKAVFDRRHARLVLSKTSKELLHFRTSPWVVSRHAAEGHVAGIGCWRRLSCGRVDRAGDAVEGLVQLVAEQR